jgi:hypothetical protein
MQTAENNINTKKGVIKMPLGPKDINGIRKEFINNVFQNIDGKLQTTAPKNNDSYQIILFDYNLTISERKYIEDSYVKAGWKSATYETSVENGEMPGLVRFTLEKP